MNDNLQGRLDVALAALDRMQEQRDRAERALTRAGFTYAEGAHEWKPPVGPSASPLLDKIDQLTAQLEAANRKIAVMAELLREVIVRDDFDREDGDSAGRLLYRIDAALAGELPEQADTPWTDEELQLASQEDYCEIQRQRDELLTKLKRRPFHTLMAAADMLDKENHQLARLNGGKVYISTDELRTVAQMVLDGRLEVPADE